MQNKTVNIITAILVFLNSFLVVADKFSPDLASSLPPNLVHAWPLVSMIILAFHAGIKGLLEHLGKLSILIFFATLQFGCVNGKYKGPTFTAGLEYTQQTSQGDVAAHLDTTFVHQK